MLSMTGYGQAELSREGLTLKIEIQSLNSRYFDLNLRLARALQSQEARVRKRIQKALNRGKISVNVTLSEERGSVAALDVNLERLRQYEALFEKIRVALDLEGGATLADYLERSDLFNSAENDRGDLAGELLTAGLDAALEATLTMRAEEGAHLAADLDQRLQLISDQTEAVETLAKGNRQNDIDRHRSRIAELAAGVPLNEDRLLMEVAILAEKRDIVEECTRLASHRDLFRSYLAGAEATGKRMGFLLQEMGREINTIGSKSAQVEISHRVVEMKEELERMREQVQNIL